MGRLRIEHDIDVVIAQSENVTHGKGMSLAHFNELRSHGIDIFTGGNHTFERADNMRLVADTSRPVTAPGNVNNRKFPAYKIYALGSENIFIASIMGTAYPEASNEHFNNQLKFADELVEIINQQKPTLSIINFHGDLSSQKVTIGHYLDGKVSAVIGDHWHVPTLDHRILPKGTAHVSDVGMCGSLDSSLGASFETVISRWSGKKVKLQIEENGPMQLNGLIMEFDDSVCVVVDRLRTIS